MNKQTQEQYEGQPRAPRRGGRASAAAGTKEDAPCADERAVVEDPVGSDLLDEQEPKPREGWSKERHLGPGAVLVVVRSASRWLEEGRQAGQGRVLRRGGRRESAEQSRTVRAGRERASTRSVGGRSVVQRA